MVTLLASILVRTLMIAAPPQTYAQTSPPSTEATSLLPTGEASVDHGDGPLVTPMAMMRPNTPLAASFCPAPMAFMLPGFLRETSQFGRRVSPVEGGWRMHKGIDMAAPLGSPVIAATPGTVLRSEWAHGYGNLIVISHGQGLTTRYAHLQRSLVHRGEDVAPGQEIGLVGATGHATGSHLHFEIRMDDQPLDPARASPVFCNLAHNDIFGDSAPMAPRLGEVLATLAWTNPHSDGRLPTNILR